MLHHVDVHVREIEPVRQLFDALCETIRYRRRYADDDFVSYEPVAGGRPRIGFLREAETGGTARLAFAVDSWEQVNVAAELAVANGAAVVEGPGLNPEYGEDYYAVFFEDGQGNRFEVIADPPALRSQPRVARIWRSRVKPGRLRAYRRYIAKTGIPDYLNTAGNCGAWILSSQTDEHDDVITLSFWDSRASIVKFAGADISRAQYYPEDAEYLLEFPETVEHFDID